MALLTRAARLLGPRRRGGRLMVQTFMPHHEVIQAALLADPVPLSLIAERQRRELLGLPPAAGPPVCSGTGSDEVAEQLRRCRGTLGRRRTRRLPRDRSDVAPSWGERLVAAERPKGSCVRIAVDVPPRV